MQKISFPTHSKLEIIDITADVEKIISSFGLFDGLCLVFCPHATSALYVNENESGLKEDILNFLQKLVPFGDYRHNMIDDNAQAHILSSLIGTSLTLPVQGGKILRGRWQNIFFVELDGPRSMREVIVEIVKT